MADQEAEKGVLASFSLTAGGVCQGPQPGSWLSWVAMMPAVGAAVKAPKPLWNGMDRATLTPLGLQNQSPSVPLTPTLSLKGEGVKLAQLLCHYVLTPFNKVLQ